MREEGTLFVLPEVDFSQGLRVSVTDPGTASRWIANYHYTGTVNPSSTPFGVFAPDLMAVVSVGQPSNDHGIASKFGLGEFEGNREITRVAVHPQAPPNAASRCIAAVCVCVAKSGLEWVFSYADTGQNHHGGIYQALGAVYVGMTGPHPGFLLDGEPIHPRTVVSRFGTMAREAAPRIAAEQGHRLEWIADLNTAKHTYIIPIGNRRSQRAIRRALRVVEKPYPKRAVEEQKAARRLPMSEVAGSIPADRSTQANDGNRRRAQ